MLKDVKRRTFIWVAGAAVALSALVPPAFAQDELIFNVFIPRAAPLYKNGLEPWAREVEAASNGAIKITIPTSSLAPAGKQYDLVLDGVADLTIAPLAFKRKKYSLNMITSLPLISETARGASVAAWETHAEHLAQAGQWKDLIPLTFFALGAPAILSNAQPIGSTEDLKGFKVLAVGKDKIQTWQNLGAVPVGGQGQKPFEVVSSGVADGATQPLGTGVTQGMLEATKTVTMVPGGMGGRATFALFISRDRFEGLSAEAQEALTVTSGAMLAGKLGAIMDRIDGTGLKKFQEKGIPIQTASEEFVNEIAEAGSFISVNWVKAAEDAGIDAEAALTHFRDVAASNP